VRILYVAAGIDLPGSHGGSTHTWEVAHGLRLRGHDVTVVATQPRKARTRGWTARREVDGVHIRYLDLPKPLSIFGYPVLAHFLRELRPAVVMERYYNLAGAGVLAAHRHRIPVLLEVNALIVDPPAVFKRRLDDRLGGPFRRWATWQCQAADRIVTPLAGTVPPAVARDKIVELPWGANVERFAPGIACERAQALRRELALPENQPVAVFTGSFRVWHGAADFVAAAVRLLDQGASYNFVLVGDGPEREAAERHAGRYRDRFRFVGSVPHADVPAYLGLATVGVAPFNTGGHPALRAAGFFWSPLKIYEYMAMGLPVVTPDIPPLAATIRERIEGALYPEGDIPALAAAIRRVVEAPDRHEMGVRARERVVRDFSWQRHCRELERVLTEIISRRGGMAHG